LLGAAESVTDSGSLIFIWIRRIKPWRSGENKDDIEESNIRVVKKHPSGLNCDVSWKEWILGLKVNADKLIFDPCIPKVWHSYSISYQHKNTHYEITIENPQGVSRGISLIELDGVQQLGGSSISLQDDGQPHQVRVMLGNE
jgi:hypothetical protein